MKLMGLIYTKFLSVFSYLIFLLNNQELEYENVLFTTHCCQKSMYILVLPNLRTFYYNFFYTGLSVMLTVFSALDLTWELDVLFELDEDINIVLWVHCGARDGTNGLKGLLPERRGPCCIDGEHCTALSIAAQNRKTAEA
ncbi:hypothetical protein BpHYR1_017551 [Brachionus plicatilis]|uniref:Uncharacterized protein n=1 Tax=Brachionus plicatilis TaxID=10195 RepID=A0A3M7R2R3_BRAPC|nr:hypothetical protein BpHYR1_017551 [Brachionus plicatilis]